MQDLQLTYFTVYPTLILDHGNNNEMHLGGYLLTNIYLPCNGGSHRRCCHKETAKTFQPAFFLCRIFATWRQKTGLMNLTKGILVILFLKSTYLEQKKA